MKIQFPDESGNNSVSDLDSPQRSFFAIAELKQPRFLRTFWGNQIKFMFWIRKEKKRGPESTILKSYCMLKERSEDSHSAPEFMPRVRLLHLRQIKNLFRPLLTIQSPRFCKPTTHSCLAISLPRSQERFHNLVTYLPGPKTPRLEPWVACL